MSTNDPETGIILVDHGSRLAEANAMLEEVARVYREQTGARIVEPAHMELAAPSIADAFDRCVAQGAGRIIVQLFFLSPGRHSMRDIPRLTAEASAAHPGVTYAVSRPIGIDPRLIEVLAARVAETIAGAAQAGGGDRRPALPGDS